MLRIVILRSIKCFRHLQYRDNFHHGEFKERKCQKPSKQANAICRDNAYSSKKYQTQTEFPVFQSQSKMRLGLLLRFTMRNETCSERSAFQIRSGINQCAGLIVHSIQRSFSDPRVTPCSVSVVSGAHSIHTVGSEEL